MLIRFWKVIEQTFTRWNRNDGASLAAATAYYAAFSFFPLVWVLIAALGFALRFSESAQNARTELLRVLAERAAPALQDEVARILSEVETRAPSSGWVGIVVFIFGAIGIFSQMEFAFDRLWHNTAPQHHGIRGAITNALWNRLKAFLTLIALGLLMILSLAADLMLAAAQTWTETFADVTANVWPSVQLGVTVGLNAAVMTLLYRLIPRAKVRWLHAASGGIVVAVVWQFGSQLLSRFIISGNYSAYGVVGSFIAVMLWVYCASILLYLGGQLVQVLGHPVEPPPPPIG